MEFKGITLTDLFLPSFMTYWVTKIKLVLTCVAITQLSGFWLFREHPILSKNYNINIDINIS